MKSRRSRPWFSFLYCYKCGKYGSPAFGVVGSMRDTKKSVYEPRPGTKGITYARYRIRYIRHYDSEEYHSQMKRYRNHEIKSRSNGQRRCYIPIIVNFRQNDNVRCVAAYCKYDYYYNPRYSNPRSHSSEHLPRVWKAKPNRSTKPIMTEPAILIH